MGAMAFIWASLSLSINQQRLGMLVGLMFGMAFRCRAMQLTLERQHALWEYDSNYNDDPQYDQSYGEPLHHPSGSLRY
jgi:hypothetical protein